MKYNIYINQRVLSQYDIDIKDMAIFDYVHVICGSTNKSVEKERYLGFTWVNYEKLMENMPALKIKSRNSISKRISNLEKAGLISTKKRMVKGNRRVFVKMTTLADSVFVESTERVLSDEKRVLSDDERVRESVQDTTIKDTTIRDKKVPQSLNRKVSFLLELPEEYIKEVTSVYDISRTELILKGEQLHQWVLSKGKENDYKNFQAFISGAISRDFKKKAEKKVDILDYEGPCY